MSCIKLKVNREIISSVFLFFFSIFTLGAKAHQCSLASALRYLEVSDLEGAILHQADSSAVSQDPLAIFLPLDARYGVSHDVAVQLSGRAGS